MSLYDLPNIQLPRLPSPKIRWPRIGRFLVLAILIVFFSSLFGFLAGTIAGTYFHEEFSQYLQKLKIEGLGQKVVERERVIEKEYLPQTSQEEAIIKAVERTSSAVVNIVITKDLPIFEEYYINPFEGQPFEEFFEFKVPQYRQKGTEKKEVGGGTGFIVSEDGLILTNKHVVLDQKADYTVLTNEGQKFPAKVLALDPFQDLAVIKIEREKMINEQGEFVAKAFAVVKLGNSDKLRIGQTVIAIGNALGEFRNTVSVGVISGLGRTITASGGGLTEKIEDVIQTDAAINRGNSGGPLLNLKGEVVGINVAMAEAAQSIGFAIPVNYAKKDIEQITTIGKIAPPFLGIYYTLLNEKLKIQYNLPVDYGAWVGRNDYGKPTDTAVFPGSAAEKAGLKRDDIILEFDGPKITQENTLKKIISRYNPGDKVILKILREGKEMSLEVILGTRTE